MSRRAGDLDQQMVEVEARASALERELDRMKAVLDSLPLGVVVTDKDGGVVFRNVRALALEAARDAEALASRAVADQLAAGGARRQTLDLYGPPRRSLVVTTEPLGEGEARLGTVAVVEDVTERRQLDAVRRDFVANVSHELRTPVGALGVLAETLSGEENRDVIERLCERISAEADRAARIIDDLLDLSRIEGGGAIERSEIAVADLVARAVEQVSAAAGRRNVEIAVGPTAAAGRILADEAQVVSALANLLDNACKYSEPGSRVEVEVSVDASAVEIAVRDHGVGIPHKDLERVFERFYRVDQARSRQTGGTGLGLAIVRHVAANHGGEVSVTSREGEGSTFTLRLPRGVG